MQKLFDRIPELEYVSSFRWGITEIFYTTCDRDEAAKRFEEYRELLGEEDTELQGFFATYDEHRDGILAYFDQRKTSTI